MHVRDDDTSPSQPLLQTRQASGSCRPKMFWTPWYQSSSRACLSCPLSGRHNLQVFIPIVFSASCTLDIFTGCCSWHVAVLDALIFVIANISTSRLPISDIRLDVMLLILLIASWTLHTLGIELDEYDSGVDQVRVQLQPFMAICLWQASMLLLLGVRVVVLGPSLMYLFILISIIGGLPTWLVVFASTTLILCGWWREKTLADAALYRLGNARLLEVFGFGSCSFSSDMVIVEACGQLCDLFGVDSLLGAQFLDLIRNEDQEILESRLQSLFHQEVGDTDVCVVTCRPPGSNEPFVCKLFIFCRTQRFVKVCFQLITVADAPPAAQATQDASDASSQGEAVDGNIFDLLSVSEASVRQASLRDAEVQTERAPPSRPSYGLPPRIPIRPSIGGTNHGVQEDDVNPLLANVAAAARLDRMRRPKSKGGDSLQRLATNHSLPRPDEIGSGGAAGFQLTSTSGLHNSILMLVKHWNLVRLPGACCPHHNALVHCRRIVKNTIKTPCQPVWTPCRAWQCHKCTCMNDNDEHICDICLTEQHGSDTDSRPLRPPQMPSDVAPDSSSSTSLSAKVVVEERVGEHREERLILHEL